MMLSLVLEGLLVFAVISSLGGVLPDGDTHRQKILSRQRRYLIFPENAALLARLSLSDNLIGVTEPNNWFHIIELDAIYKLPNTSRLDPFKKNKNKKPETGSHNTEKPKPQHDIHHYEEEKPDNYYYIDEKPDNYYHTEAKIDGHHYGQAKPGTYYKQAKPEPYYKQARQDTYHKQPGPDTYYKQPRQDTYYKQAKQDTNYEQPRQDTYYKEAKQDDYYFSHRRDRRDVYNEMRGLLDSQGLDGHACVLRAICEAKHVLSQATQLSIFEEILQAIFTIPPGNDDLFQDDVRTNEDSTTEAACEQWFSQCHISLLDFVFSNTDFHL